MPKAIHGDGLIEDQKDVTASLTDTPATPNALLQNGSLYANAILVGQDGSSVGAVKITFLDDTFDTIPYLVPGIWHNQKPFKHVWLSGTTADSVRVGVTF